MLLFSYPARTIFFRWYEGLDLAAASLQEFGAHIELFPLALQRMRPEPSPFEQEMPIYPLEQHLGYMIHLRILQQAQGSEGRKRKIADHRLDLVIVIDCIGFPEARLDKSEGMAVEAGVLCSPFEDSRVNRIFKQYEKKGVEIGRAHV